MGTPRSLKGTLRTVLSRAGMASFWDEDATPDSAKDYPISLVNAIKRQIDIHLSQFFRGVFGLTTPASDFVILYGGEISVAGSVYTVDTEGYAIYNGELYKINTGNATLSDTIRLVVSSTEDELIRTLDIEDGTSGSGLVNYANIKRVKGLFEVDPINGFVMVGSKLSGQFNGQVRFVQGASANLSYLHLLGKSGGTGIRIYGSGIIQLGSVAIPTVSSTDTLTNKTLTSPTINSGDINSPDIDGGTVDGAAIGGSSPSTGVFTTLQATTGMTSPRFNSFRLTGTVAGSGSTVPIAYNNASLSNTTGYKIRLYKYRNSSIASGISIAEYMYASNNTASASVNRFSLIGGDETGGALTYSTGTGDFTLTNADGSTNSYVIEFTSL